MAFNATSLAVDVGAAVFYRTALVASSCRAEGT